MKISCFLLLSFIFLSACTTSKSVILFNANTNLKDWKQVGEGNFIIKDHLLQSQGGMGLLYYTKHKLGNVKLHVIYKVTYADTNSGVFVRIGKAPKTAWDAVHGGYEIQICDSGKDAFDTYHKTGAIYTFSKAESQAANHPGEWNSLDIILSENKITVYLNGVKTSSYTTGDPAPQRLRYSDPQRGLRPIYGYVGLQNHDQGAPKQDSHVYFKEISVRPL